MISININSVVVALLAIGCSYFAQDCLAATVGNVSDDASKVKTEWGMVTGGVRLSVSSESTNVKVGNQVYVTVKIHNATQHALVLWETYPDGDYALAVNTADGRCVPKTSYQRLIEENEGESLRRTKRVLDAGQVHSNRLDVSRRYNMTAAGQYEISASRRIVTASGGWTNVVSNVAVVDISQ